MRKTLVFLCLILLSISVYAAVPQRLSFQGYLPSVSDGNHSVRIAIYYVASGGDIKQQETQTISFSNGIFSVILPEASADPELSGAVDLDTAYFGIAIDGAAEISPRYQIQYLPYAFLADSVSGESVYIVSAQNNWIGVSSQAMRTEGAAVYGKGLLGGVLGSSEAANGYGLAGHALANSGIGINAQNYSTSGTGLYAVNTGAVGASSGSALHVRGKIKLDNEASGTYPKPCGIGTLEALGVRVTINNPLVTDNSLIFITIVDSDAIAFKGLKIDSKVADTSFTVGTVTGGNIASAVTFKYLIIN